MTSSGSYAAVELITTMQGISERLNGTRRNFYRYSAESDSKLYDVTVYEDGCIDYMVNCVVVPALPAKSSIARRLLQYVAKEQLS